MGKGACVNVRCMTTWFLVFAAVLFLVAGGLFGVGLWTLLMRNEYESLLGSVTYITIVGLTITGGLFSMFVCLFGIIGAVRESKFMVSGFILLILIVCLLELVGGVVAYIYRGEVEVRVRRSLNVTIASNYGMIGNGKKTKAVDFLQKSYNCCGDVDYKSWEKSEWFKHNVNGTSLYVPDSCCITPSEDCGARIHPSNIWRNDLKAIGCYASLEKYMIDHLFIVGIACLSSGVAQVICIFLSLWLYKLYREFR